MVVRGVGMQDKLSALALGAAGVNLYLGLTLEQWLGIAGFVLGLLTFGINWYYRRLEDKRNRLRLRRDLGLPVCESDVV